MGGKFGFKYVALLLFGLSLWTVGLFHLKTTNKENPKTVASSYEYLVDLPDCKIPAIPYLPEALLPEWDEPFISNCPTKPRFATIMEDEKLKVSDVDSYKRCCFTEILRPQQLKSDTYEVSQNCTQFESGDEIDVSKMEFLVLYCETHNSSVKTEFHYNFPRTNPNLVKKLEYWKDYDYSKLMKPFNVKLLIIDSLTRAHGYRSLPKTIKYLEEKFGFINLKAYHATGEPTFENYVPMMLGFTSAETKWNRTNKSDYTGKYDNEPFIWKNFSSMHYVTMDVGDMAVWHTFHFNGRTGFTERQMDFNTRPYFLMQEKVSPKTRFVRRRGIKIAKLLHYGVLNCLDGKHVYQFLLDYTKEFEEKFKGVPKFSITFWGWPSHDSLSSVKRFDEPILKYFKEMDPEIRDNTIHFFMGDHGYRWANYSETKYGLLERDLPFFLINLPPKFISMYPEAHENLKINSERLTSHVDLFKTLVDIHQKMSLLVKDKTSVSELDNLSYGYNYEYGISLFSEIPLNRTCKDAKVPNAFCSCNFPVTEQFEYDKYNKAPVREGFSAIKNSSNA